MAPQRLLHSSYLKADLPADYSTIRELQLTSSAVSAPWELRHLLCGFLRWVWESSCPFSSGNLLALKGARPPCQVERGTFPFFGNLTGVRFQLSNAGTRGRLEGREREL